MDCAGTKAWVSGLFVWGFPAVMVFGEVEGDVVLALC